MSEDSPVWWNLVRIFLVNEEDGTEKMISILQAMEDVVLLQNTEPFNYMSVSYF